MTEKTLRIETADPLLLFGPNDQHLHTLSAAFPDTEIIARGNQVFLRGTEADTIEQILVELTVLINRNGHVTTNDVETVLDLTTTGQGMPRTEAADVVLFTPDGIIKPKTPGQQAFFEAAKANDIAFAVGPAGTGKTYMAVALAVAALKAKQVKRIVLSRPAVEAGEQLGFLPGNLREKIDPYLRPLYDALEDMLPREKLRDYLDQNIVEIVPLAYMRGRTLNSAFLILDEAQNATNAQMKMFLTRLGPNSRAIITGDITQTDLPKSTESGLVQAQHILKDVPGIAFHYFGRNDVVRHRLVKDIIAAYEAQD